MRVPEFKQLKFDLEQLRSGITGTVAAGTAAISAQAAALFGVGSLAAAGTGTAISGPTGVAAQNATLAWLGGGTLAAGGFGAAGGAVVLTLIAVIPAATIIGLTVRISGARQKRKAAEAVADGRVKIASVQVANDLLARIGDRVNELRDVLMATSSRAEDALTQLEALDFDDEAHGPELARVVALIRALREILNVAVIDEDGQLTDESVEIIARYR